MDTKSKNIDDKGKERNEKIEKHLKTSKILRTAAIVITVVMLAVSILSFKDITNNIDVLKNDGLYSDSFLGGQIREFYGEVLKFSALYKNEEYVKDISNITQSEINIYKEQMENAKQQEIEKERNNLYNNYDESAADKKLDAAIDEINEKYQMADAEIREKIAEVKLNEFNILKNSFNTYDNLKFIAYDKENDIWISNISDSSGNKQDMVDGLRNSSRYFAKYSLDSNSCSIVRYLDGKASGNENYDYISNYNTISETYSYFENVGSGRSSITAKNLDIYISIPESLTAGDAVYQTVLKYNELHRSFKNELIIFAVAAASAIVLIILLKKNKKKSTYFEFLEDKLWKLNIEKTALILLIGIVILDMVTNRWGYWFSHYRYKFTVVSVVMWSIFLIFLYLIGGVSYKKYKTGELLKDSHVIEFIDNCKISLEKKSFGRKLFILAAMYFVSAVLILVVLAGMLGTLGAAAAIMLIFVATVMLLFTVVRDLAYLNTITNYARMMYEGRSSEDIPEKKGSGALTDLAHSINNMKDGLRKSIENETKSERMKTELITNVSHDLKTPLTSIINYVDLLKRVDVQPEEARAYVEILDKKSQRLKILIEDLFEASKAASGSMKLNMEKLDIIALLNQTIGEAEGRIEEAKLNLKLNLPNEKIYVNGDGRRLWRVFENLINNIIKYSLTGTRVYIDAKEEDGKIIISMKNISVNELNFNDEEITERFVRGEQSRHTEGSGLGLAIAKSIVELHGGTLKITTDGDLFKASVIFDTIKAN